ncbi:cation:proton antiporter [Oceanicaulis sp. MMSF_3324]|uniref:cation:proton antiporter domain-containing protein n=1 Tax=Oceanicaulis sp. MMSF_3324 TaxID=3046702 RepID=UPI00273F23A7|nr:cation:proton antiporter [Oceanicaulis sp. MMSF_3324]
MGDFLLLATLFLGAGVIAVPLATRLGLGSVLGYLLAGIALSPILGLLHVDVIAIQHFAEFGVVMMLFIVGLELEPRRLWEMRGRLLGLGGLQVGITAAVVIAICLSFGMPWRQGVAVGFIIALSSTAIVLQTLTERGLMNSDGGRSSFSVLLFQDIAVIFMLALFPLLSAPDLFGSTVTHGGESASGHGGGGDLTPFTGLPGWGQGLVSLAAIAIVVGIGSYLTRPLFRFIAMARLRELFTAAALMLVVGIALLMTLAGLSPALGAFLAGVVLANSEYRHELESHIDPFRGLLLGLFFITVGAAVDFQLLADQFWSTLGMTLGVIVIKALILFALSLVFRIGGSDRWLFTLGLAQAGEFGFVLLTLTVSENILPTAVSSQLLLVVALSMLLTPGLFVLYDRICVIMAKRREPAEADEIDSTADIIIAGHGRVGGIVNRMLRAYGHETTVLDYSSSQLEALRAFGFKVFFGDASRPDLLHAAGIENAKLLIVALDNRDQITELVRYVCKHHPHVHVIARATSREHVYDLYAVGCRDMIRETFDSSVRIGRSAFEALGAHAFDAEQMSRAFVQEDRKMLREMAEVYDPDIPNHKNPAFVTRAREVLARQQDELSGGGRVLGAMNDRRWSPPTPKDVRVERDQARSDPDAPD